jgi:hypothetical protein
MKTASVAGVRIALVYRVQQLRHFGHFFTQV